MAELLTDLTIVLPSLNPDEKFAGVVDGLVHAGFSDIVIINDGSDPDRLHWFQQAETYPAVTVLTHEVNRGKGRALKTGFEFILANRPHSLGAVTIDVDGQHLLPDIMACGQAMLDHPDKVILGCRDFSRQCFLCNRKLCFHYIKTLREDRTAADKKHVAYCDPPQAENLAGEILFIQL